MLDPRKLPKPPKAKKTPFSLQIHNDERIDNYYWMKLTDEQKSKAVPDQKTKEVVDYLEKENAYTKDTLTPLESRKEQIFQEIINRIKQTDMSVPVFKNGYFYSTKYEEEKEYPVYIRKRSIGNDDQVLIDVNKLASDYKYYDAKGLSVSSDNKILAFGEDSVSRRQYKLRFKNLETGSFLVDEIENTTGTCVWANNNKTIFYTRKDNSLRSFKIFKHTIGALAKDDVLVYHEPDDTFNAFVYKTKSNKYILVGSWATLSQEFHFIDADKPNGELVLFQRRKKGLEYDIAHHENSWFIRTNVDKAQNFKVMKTDLSKTKKEDWKEVIPHNPSILIEKIEAFKNEMVLSIRNNGMTEIELRKWKNFENPISIRFNEKAYYVTTSNNPEYELDNLRLSYTSMTTPISTYDFNVNSRELVLLKQQEVIGSFDKDNYVSDRIFATTEEGEKIPISIVYKKGNKKDGSMPLLLYAYGSYGHSMDPYFSSARLSLLDRGFAFAIAHIRGGEEMGRSWYENGKFLKKKNTFLDYIACGKQLVSDKYCSKDLLFAMGGSAGGLLMGAVMNMAPELWKGVIAAVPFVDVVTTMLDDSIPLTTGEYDEWGNPNDKTYYHYMKSYSPYDNIEKKDYPALLVTSGYHDSQVQYWEPTKWVAKLRDYKTDNNILLLHTNMEGGHGGNSGRFQRFKEVAMEYTFLLSLAGKLD